MLTAKLCKACENGDAKEVEELLASGATPNFAPSGNGCRYPLHYAATHGHVEIVKLLLQHEATVDPLEASNGWTPLMIATLKSTTSQKHIDVMMLLLESGADAEATDARGNTILHMLASLGQTTLLKRLLQGIPSLDILGPGFGYLTPLHYATEAGHMDTVEFLLQMRADPRCVDATGWTPVHWACRRGNKPVVDLLLSYGGSTEDRDFRSLTPVDVACLFNHSALAKLLDAQTLPRGETGVSASENRPAASIPIEIGDGMHKEDSQVIRMPIVEQSCSVISTNTSRRGEKYHLKQEGHAFARLILGACIPVVSVCDYLSRVSMAAFFATAAKTLEGVSPAMIVATVLACCSVVLPSVALGFCCSCHFRNIGIWAAWKTAKFIRAVVDSESAQPTRLRLEDLLLPDLWRRLLTLILYSENNTALKVLAAGCILPPAALVCCFLLVAQIVVVATAALFAVLSLWTLSIMWISVLKAFLVSRRGLLVYLDCLTHASALRVTSAERRTQKDRDLFTARAREFSRSIKGHIRSTGSDYSFDSLSSRFCQGPRRAGKEQTGPKPSNSCSLADARGNETRAIEGKEADTQCQQARDCGDSNLPVKCFGYYTSATHCGSVPQKLHPCPSLQWAIQLHRQHLEINEGRQFLVTHWRVGTQQPANTGTSSSGASGTVSARDLKPTQQEKVIHETAGLNVHGRGSRLFDDSLRAEAYADDSDRASAVCNEAQERSWSRGVEQGLNRSPDFGDKSQVTFFCPDNHTGDPLCHGILAFQYGDQVQELHGGFHGVAESRSVAPRFERSAPDEAATPRWNNAMSLKKVSAAAGFVGTHHYGWMQRTPKHQHAFPERTSSQVVPSVTSCAAPEDPPDVSGKRIHDAKYLSPWLNSHPETALPSADFHANAGWNGCKFLFAGAPSAMCLASAESVGGKRGHMQEKREPLSRSRTSKNDKQRSLKPHIDDEEYDAMVVQRERRIFNWFERTVAFRYAEVAAMSKSTAAINGTVSEIESCSSGEDPRETLPPVLNAAPSVDQVKAGIEWDTFGTLFPQKECTTQVNGLEGGSAGFILKEEKRLPCLCTEDVFDMPVGVPVKSNSGQYVCGKGHHQQRVFDLPRNKMKRFSLDLPASVHWSNAAGPGTSVGGSSTRGDSGSDEFATPVLHYRFKDMVELPQFHEVFFSLWCREFEKLLLYQNPYIGENSVWVASVLGEDGISDSLQEDSPRQSNVEVCASTRQARIQDDTNALSKHSSCGGEMLRTVRCPVSEPQADCSLQLSVARRAEEGGTDEGISCDQAHICTGTTEHPIACSVSVSRGALDAVRHISLSKRRCLPRGNSLHGLLTHGGSGFAHSSTVSDLVSVFGNMEEEGMEEHTNSGAKFVLVAEACRFLFALSLTLDLVLGLLPLLGAIILLFVLPYRALTPYPNTAESSAYYFRNACSQSDADTTAISAILLLLAHSPFTFTVCALRHIFLWSIVLTSVVAIFYAALMFTRASRVFFPLKQ